MNSWCEFANQMSVILLPVPRCSNLNGSFDMVRHQLNGPRQRRSPCLVQPTVTLLGQEEVVLKGNRYDSGQRLESATPVSALRNARLRATSASAATHTHAKG